jgi:sirohydrochlorin cobaltochelatase
VISSSYRPVVSVAAFSLAVATIFAFATMPTPAGAQTSSPAASGSHGAPTIGTLIVAHGGDSRWNAHVRQVAAAARTGGPVEVSFLMGPEAKTTRFQDAVARLEAQKVAAVVVVPMLVSSHSGHYDQIRYLAGEPVTIDAQMMHHLHMAGIERPSAKVPISLTKAMDAAPEVARVLSDRALALARTPAEQAVLIVGHGPNSAEDYAAWMENLRPVADSVKAWGRFRDVRVELVRDDAPPPVRAEAVRRVRELIELQHLATGRDVVVVPVLVSKGSVSRDKVPADIKGTPSVYAGEPLLPHPVMARWIESRVRQATGQPSVDE